ncbi:MAG: hypothetical protein HQK65_02285 [Desulfamplus sp.]|nr:hypothetical protein [Desulfamplus sp.]
MEIYNIVILVGSEVDEVESFKSLYYAEARFKELFSKFGGNGTIEEALSEERFETSNKWVFLVGSQLSQNMFFNPSFEVSEY